MKRTNINLTEDDQQSIRIIRQRYGLTNDTAAIRLALHLIAQRKESKMKAVEIKLDNGTFYIPLATYDHNKVLIPMDGGERVLTPGDIRVNWDAWVSDEVPDSLLLTADELAVQHPGIAIDRE